MEVAGRKFDFAEGMEYVYSVLGGIMYAVGLNLFIFPMGLYIGTITGIAQMIQSIINNVANTNLAMTGLFLFVLNLPLLFLTYRLINKSFFYKTVVTITAQSLAMALVPVAQTPLITDCLTLCVIGGLFCGFGAGFTLRHGGSGGGLDILGVYLSLKFRNFSVGKVALLVSSIVMVYVAISFPVEILIYSIIFTIVYSIVLDHIHYQNVKVFALIVTSNDEVPTFINNRVGRGVTMWEATGVYSRQKKMVIMAIVDKYQFLNLKKNLVELDPQVFMVNSEQIDVTGTFEKQLFS